MIDGGIGQVNAVDGVLKSLGVDIPIVGLAEKNEELYRPHNSTPIVLPRRSDGLRLLQRVREETHRFATTQNQKLRTKFNTQNLFKDISGIGEKRAAVLLKKYFSLENLCEADAKELSEVLGIKTEQALSILKEAESLLKKQNETKEKSRHSLGAVGTTWQKAAENQYTIDLAEAALEAAEEEPEYGGDSEIDNSGINQSDDNNLDEPEETDD